MFRFFPQRKPLSKSADKFALTQHRWELQFDGLVAGVDNLRHDVFLSARFREAARALIVRLIARYGNVTDLAGERSTPTKPPSVLPRASAPGAQTAKSADPPDFKQAAADLLTGALNKAKAEQNTAIDLLARVAVIKFLRSEMSAQFANMVERCRAKLTSDSLGDASRRAELHDRLGKLQTSKRSILRRCGQDLFGVLRDVEKETLARTRRAIFANAPAEAYELFSNRLLLAEKLQDDTIAAEHYCMLGHYERDPDRLSGMRELALELLREVSGSAKHEALEAMLASPENAQELIAGGTPDKRTEKGAAQAAVLDRWQGMLEREDAMRSLVAAYAAVPLLPLYVPHANPQEIKYALISSREQRRVGNLLRERGCDIRPFLEAAHAVNKCSGKERKKIAARFLLDLMRYDRDLKRAEAVTDAAESINIITTERLHELSSINRTLYEFLLSDEQKREQESIVGHVIIKADVRDSTALTRSLVDRGLNPASYFSLNFYDPITKLLPNYGAAKVFIEGDAVILAILEHEGQARMAVSRACVLAREMLQIVRAYNEQLTETGLPKLELGIGICYEPDAPLYLMDGNHRVMISKALNESDRLSSCSKSARNWIKPGALFRVHTAEAINSGDSEDVLVRFNLHGIQLSEGAFKKLREEVVLEEHDIAADDGFGSKRLKLYVGEVPTTTNAFRELILREGRVAQVNRADLANRGWTDRKYFEVCAEPGVSALLQQRRAAAAK